MCISLFNNIYKRPKIQQETAGVSDWKHVCWMVYMSFFQGRWSAFTADITKKKKKMIFFHGFPFNFSAPPQPYLVPLVVKPRRPLQHLLIFLFEPTSSLPTPFLQRPATTDDFLLRLSLEKNHDYISLLQLLLVVYLFRDFKNFLLFFY